MKIQTLSIVLLFILFHGEFYVSCSQIEKCALLNKFLKCHRSFEYHEYCYETKPYDKTICCIQALKSKWWEEGECTNNAIVGSSAEKSMQLDIPHLGKTFKEFETKL